MDKNLNRLLALLSLLPVALFVCTLPDLTRGEALFNAPNRWLIVGCLLLSIAATIFAATVTKRRPAMLVQAFIIFQGTIYAVEALALSSGIHHGPVPTMPFYVQGCYSLALALMNGFIHPANRPTARPPRSGSTRTVQIDPVTGATLLVTSETTYSDSNDDRHRHHHHHHHHSGADSHHSHSGHSDSGSSGDSGGGDSGGDSGGSSD